jgi:hypothetical protein
VDGQSEEPFDLARAEPDRVYREGTNWMWVGPDNVARIMCPRCWNGGGGYLATIRLKGSADAFYWCFECDALWPVEQFDWGHYTVALLDLGTTLDARGLRFDDFVVV